MWHWTITFRSANFLSFHIICGLYTWQLEFCLSHLQMENSAGGWEFSLLQVWLCSFSSRRYIRTDSYSGRKALQGIIFLYTILLVFIVDFVTVEKSNSIYGLSMLHWFWPFALFYLQCLSSSILYLMYWQHLRWRRLCILCAMVRLQR